MLKNLLASMVSATPSEGYGGVLQREFDGETLFTAEVVMGIPFHEIIKKASKRSADLIVVGTHGRTGVEHVFVGSTAERLVRRSTIPVLTVRCED